MLWNRGEALIQHVLQRKMIGTNDETMTPKVGSPVPDRLNQADELALISSHLQVARREGLAEEGQGSGALMQDGTKPRA